MRDLFEILKEKVDNNYSLYDQEIVVDGYKYYFEEIEEEDWVDEGKYSYSSSIYRVAKWTYDGKFVEDLDLYLRQSCTRYGSYYNGYEYEFDSVEMVEEREETITRKYWAVICD